MPPITYTINGGEFHFCVFNAYFNSTYYGSPTANSLLWCQTHTDEATQDFVFTSNGVSYDSIHLVGDKDIPDNRKMYYVSGGVETLVYHNDAWTLEAYKILTYETQSVRERIEELIVGTQGVGVSGGFSAPSGIYKVSAPLAAVAVYSAFIFSEFVSNGATFYSIQWSLETGSSPEATVEYGKPSVNDVYSHTAVYSDGWVKAGYETITIPDGAYMSYNTIDIFSERLTQVSRLSVDLTTLSGWASLSAGSHSIQIVAKASGYRDSEKSEAVSVTKAASAHMLIFSGNGVVTMYVNNIEASSGYELTDGDKISAVGYANAIVIVNGSNITVGDELSINNQDITIVATRSGSAPQVTLFTINYSNAETLINFTINGYPHQAEEGMTWGEWCSSAFINGGYVVLSNGSVGTGTGLIYLSADPLVLVTSSDTIIAGHDYYNSGSGGSAN